MIHACSNNLCDLSFGHKGLVIRIILTEEKNWSFQTNQRDPLNSREQCHPTESFTINV